MNLRLAVAASATCLAVLAPALLGSAGPAATTSAASTTPTTKVLDGSVVEVHAIARLGEAATSEGAPEQWLRTANGTAYQVVNAQTQLDTEKNVQVTGAVSGNKVTVASATPTTSATTTTGTARTGVRSVLIMMVDWTKPDSTTAAAVQAQVGGVTDKWFRAVSYGKLGIAARTTPWMSVPKQDCSLETGGYWKVLAAAEKAAVAHGYNPRGYNHEMVYFPFDAKCNYGGLGSVNDRSSWVNGEMDSRVVNHELGHNLGLNHSRSAVCVNSSDRQVTLSGACSTDEYGDIFDTMGVPAGSTPQFNAVQMNHLGWLNGHFVAPTTSGTVALNPLETGNGTVAARIRVGTTEYWLEYRQAVGVDAVLGFFPGATDGILIHRIAADGGTDLLDASPGPSKSFSNAALRAGASWASPEKLTLKVTSATSVRAVVSITFAK